MAWPWGSHFFYFVSGSLVAQRLKLTHALKQALETVIMQDSSPATFPGLALIFVDRLGTRILSKYHNTVEWLINSVMVCS